MLENAPKDFLTGFFLREALNLFLENLIREVTANKKSFSVGLIDLDHFKKFNDKHGHLFGDEVLKYAVNTIRLTFQEHECHFFRYGGDEFILIFLDRAAKEAARLLRQYSHNLRHRPFLINNKFYKITASCGIAGFPADGQKPEALIHKADEAMYFSKCHGRNRVTLAGKIKYLRLRNILLIIGSACLIFLTVFLSYKLMFKDAVRSVFHKFKSARIITKPKELDMLILKNGDVYEGRILEETGDRVILSLYLTEGEGTVVFKKSELSAIKYGSQRTLESD